MKKAIIVVGKHYAGKSKTLKEYLKPQLGIGINKHQFIRNGQSGFVLAQTCEEANRDVKETVTKYCGYDLLVLAARPINEPGSCLAELEAELKKAGYQVKTLDIVKPEKDQYKNDYYGGKADEIISYFDEFAARTASSP